MGTRRDRFRMVFCEEIPEKPEEGVLYRSEKYKTAVHLCACGCGSKVVTPERMGWRITGGEENPTISPSIGNFQLPCRTHYFIREGKVQWV